jgi:hypothetical protein
MDKRYKEEKQSKRTRKKYEERKICVERNSNKRGSKERKIEKNERGKEKY